MIEPISIPDATAEPAAYGEALITTLGERDPLGVYAATPTEVSKLCNGLDETEWLVPLAAGEWNTQQIVGHLFDVDIVYGFRWRLTLTEDEPSYPGYNEKAWSELARPSPELLLGGFAAIRQANISLLESLDEVDWSRRAVHGEQGSEDVRHMLNKIAGHDLAHLNQLQRTLEVASGSPG